MSGDNVEVGQVFESHRRLIESTAARLADPQDVPDVVQQVGLRMCLYFRPGFHPRQVAVWIYRTTVNEALKLRRRSGHVERLSAAIEAHTTKEAAIGKSPAEEFEEQQALELLVATIGRMRAPHLGVVRNILATGGISSTGVQRHRARRHLRDLLQ